MKVDIARLAMALEMEAEKLHRTIYRVGEPQKVSSVSEQTAAHILRGLRSALIQAAHPPKENPDV